MNTEERQRLTESGNESEIIIQALSDINRAMDGFLHTRWEPEKKALREKLLSMFDRTELVDAGEGYIMRAYFTGMRSFIQCDITHNGYRTDEPELFIHDGEPMRSEIDDQSYADLCVLAGILAHKITREKTR